MVGKLNEINLVSRHSEGLQTTRVLAPIPKQAMQWTTGFPTKVYNLNLLHLGSYKENRGSFIDKFLMISASELKHFISYHFVFGSADK